MTTTTSIDPMQIGGFSVTEFREKLGGMSRTKFYSEVNSGRIKLRKIGRRSFITFKDAAEYCENLPLVPAKNNAA